MFVSLIGDVAYNVPKIMAIMYMRAKYPIIITIFA